MRAFVAIVALALAGCQHPVAERLATPEALDARDHATCVSYGTVRGTPQYLDCRHRQAGMRQNRATEYGRMLSDMNRGGGTVTCEESFGTINRTWSCR